MRSADDCPAADAVVFWTTSLDIGGSEGQLTEVAVRLRARGRPVSVVSLAGGVHVKRLRAGGVPVTCPRGVVVARILRSLRLLSHARTVVTFLYVPNLVGRLARPLLRCRLVTCFRSVWFGSPPRHLLLRATRRMDDAWISNATRSADLLVGKRFAVVGRGAVVPNGIDLPSLKDPPSTPFVWLSVGRLRREKDHATLLRAWALMDRGTARLRLVGDGPMEPTLRRLAEDLGVAGSVQFVGAVNDLGPDYDAAHAVVLSSWTEGSPNSVLEALAHGRPVVATAVGGTPEALPDGAGLLVPARDAQALAAAMDKLMRRTRRQRIEMGAVGRGHVAQTHSWDAVVDRWEDVLWPGSEEHRPTQP